jgi:polyribonucleotide nucleotidyltransferase
MPQTFAVEVGGRILSFETGKMAGQANGAVFVKYGETGVLVTAVASDRLREGIDFLPLTVDYLEMSYAAGRIPGGFFRREIGRPSEKETLTSRLIDRPIRPLFPKGFYHELQIIATVLSVDTDNDPDIIALNGASAALAISDIPFQGPIAAVRMGKIGNQLIINPTFAELKESSLNLIVAGTKDALVMVEGGADLASEEEILEALFTAHQHLQPILALQEQMAQEVGKPKRPVPEVSLNVDLKARVEALGREHISRAIREPGKQERRRLLEAGLEEILTALGPEYEGQGKEIAGFYHELEKQLVRQMILQEKRRIDGRGATDIRPITCEVGLLSRTHGSALFSRGETQALAIATLGTVSDEQRIETLTGDTFKAFMLHYNFPPYSVGETRMLRGPSRREIGHGALAERALSRVLPPQESFPYTIRVVSEILSSNGSSSMATVCGGSLAMMDAGIPIKAAVAGVAMGLIKEGEQVAVLSDILGDEDHLGDMDFKVAGTAEGITALQMDIKIGGITREIMSQALHQAREARLHILARMNEVIAAPRPELKKTAPKIVTLTINPDKIREVIGPGGKTVKGIVAATGAKVDIEDDGRIHIASPDANAADLAIKMIREITAEAEVGQIYKGKVKKIVDFGAFVEILPGTDGLVHISELDKQRVKKVTDVLKEGDEVVVKVLDVDKQGKIRLSRKAVLDLDLSGLNL